MGKLVCRSCGELYRAAFKPTAEERRCDCGGARVEPSALKPRKALKRGAPLKRTTGLKRGKGMEATPKQRDRVRGLPCVGCGAPTEWDADGEPAPCDPAHLYPRDLCPCDHTEAVIPLCRTCHRIYDDPSRRAELDLMTRITDREYLDAFAHYITAHGFSPITLLQHVSGQVWIAVESSSATGVGG